MFKDTGTGKKTPWGAGTHTGHTDKRSTNLTTIPSSKFPTHQYTNAHPRDRESTESGNQRTAADWDCNTDWVFSHLELSLYTVDGL